MQTPLFKRVFWLIAVCTVAVFGWLFSIAGPDADPSPVVTLSVVAIILALASIVVIGMYLGKKQTSQLTKVAAGVTILGLLFGIFLAGWHIVALR